ncbi:MAG0490 family ComEA-like DNA-binding protein [Metamycoplasma neophronis]|uniref:Competence protein ComEA n=1 Tax=Metamycoplasma neophronis TaxID=872983 RepID=A0ABY2YZZ6_9BACT|nr:hypothetical protein [Metamycoplasma neophronis]TPR54071.1 hypothetical protein FJR74_01355 [Metamycoplasma neophronis]
MERKKKIIFVGATFLVASLVILSSIGINSYLKNKKAKTESEQENKYATIQIYGAVYYGGEYEFKIPATLLDVIKKSRLRSGADLSKFNLNENIKDKQKIYIPYTKANRVKLKSIRSVKELVNLGIKKHIASKVLEVIKSKGNYITWDDIKNQPGVGEVTLKLLQENTII